MTDNIKISAKALRDGTYLAEVEGNQITSFIYLHQSVTAEVPFDPSEGIEEWGVYIGRHGVHAFPWRLQIGEYFTFDGFEPPPAEQRDAAERLLGWKWTELEEN